MLFSSRSKTEMERHITGKIENIWFQRFKDVQKTELYTFNPFFQIHVI